LTHRWHELTDAHIDFEDGRPVPSTDFPYHVIDGEYDLSPDVDNLKEAFCKAFDWIADVPANDFKGIAIRVQTVRCVLTGKDQTEMAREIGVTKAAISQRMCDLRDYFNLRNPKSNLRNNETRQKFSEQCKLRHQKKKKREALSSGGSPTTSTTNTKIPSHSPGMPSGAALPLSKLLYEQALS
jgi:hypothetical protein